MVIVIISNIGSGDRWNSSLKQPDAQAAIVMEGTLMGGRGGDPHEGTTVGGGVGDTMRKGGRGGSSAAQYSIEYVFWPP